MTIKTMKHEFEQRPGESDKAFAAFSLYLSMGAQRSTAAVAKQLAKSEQLVRRWSARWQWVERVAAHAQHLAVIEREATEALARTKAVEWERREQQLRETEWAMHERAIAAAKRGLDAYMERQKVYANLADIARMLEIASKLGRLATGLGTEGDRPKDEQPAAMRVEVTVALEKIYGGEGERTSNIQHPTSNIEGEIRAPQERRPTVIEAEVIEEKRKEEGREKSA
jgi:hypothetical protein